MACTYSTPTIQLNTDVDNWVQSKCTQIQSNLKGLREGAQTYNDGIANLNNALSDPALRGPTIPNQGMTFQAKFDKIRDFPTDAETDLSVVFAATTGIDNASANIKQRILNLATELNEVKNGAYPPDAVAAATTAIAILQPMLTGITKAERGAINLAALDKEFQSVKSSATISARATAAALELKKATVGLTPAEQTRLDSLNAQIQTLNNAST